MDILDKQVLEPPEYATGEYANDQDGVDAAVDKYHHYESIVGGPMGQGGTGLLPAGAEGDSGEKGWRGALRSYLSIKETPAAVKFQKQDLKDGGFLLNDQHPQSLYGVPVKVLLDSFWEHVPPTSLINVTLRGGSDSRGWETFSLQREDLAYGLTDVLDKYEAEKGESMAGKLVVAILKSTVDAIMDWEGMGGSKSSRGCATYVKEHGQEQDFFVLKLKPPGNWSKKAKPVGPRQAKQQPQPWQELQERDGKRELYETLLRRTVIFPDSKRELLWQAIVETVDSAPIRKNDKAHWLVYMHGAPIQDLHRIIPAMKEEVDRRASLIAPQTLPVDEPAQDCAPPIVPAKVPEIKRRQPEDGQDPSLLLPQKKRVTHVASLAAPRAHAPELQPVQEQALPQEGQPGQPGSSLSRSRFESYIKAQREVDMANVARMQAQQALRQQQQQQERQQQQQRQQQQAQPPAQRRIVPMPVGSSPSQHTPHSGPAAQAQAPQAPAAPAKTPPPPQPQEGAQQHDQAQLLAPQSPPAPSSPAPPGEAGSSQGVASGRVLAQAQKYFTQQYQLWVRRYQKACVALETEQSKVAAGQRSLAEAEQREQQAKSSSVEELKVQEERVRREEEELRGEFLLPETRPMHELLLHIYKARADELSADLQVANPAVIKARNDVQAAESLASMQEREIEKLLEEIGMH